MMQCALGIAGSRPHTIRSVRSARRGTQGGNVPKPRRSLRLDASASSEQVSSDGKRPAWGARLLTIA